MGQLNLIFLKKLNLFLLLLMSLYPINQGIKLILSLYLVDINLVFIYFYIY